MVSNFCSFSIESSFNFPENGLVPSWGRKVPRPADEKLQLLYKPIWPAPASKTAFLTFSRWYTNDIGDNGNTDSWKVQVSNDDGQSWIDIENTSVSNASWIKSRFILSNFIDFTENIQFKFIAEDIFNNGDAGSGGSLVEAAIDNFLLEYALTDPLILGDVNLDFVVNILDVIILVNMVLGFEQPNLSQGDINSDFQINILDVVGLVSLILDN